jgi:VanZ family protein
VTIRTRYVAARLAYVGIVLLGTLTDLHFSADTAAASRRLSRAFTLSLGWRDAIDDLRNVVFFAGLGALWIVTSLTGRVNREIWKATLAGSAISLMVEALQTFSPVRTASIVDVSTNTFGAFGGALATALLLIAVRSRKDSKSYLGIPAFLVAGPYALALLCETLTPLFHSEPIEGLYGPPLTRLRVALESAFPLSWSELQLCDIPLYAAGGFAIVLLLREGGLNSKRAALTVAIAGAALVPGVSVIHGVAGLAIRWEAVAIDMLSVVFGAWAADRWLAKLTTTLRGAARARAAIFAYMALLVLWGWRPLLPETRGAVIVGQITASHLVPLRSLAGRVDLFSVFHVMQQFMLYVPLGVLLAVWPLRLTGRWANLWPGLWLAVVIEAGHIVVAGRMLDSTNALLGIAGLAIGWVAIRRSGFSAYGAALDAR